MEQITRISNQIISVMGYQEYDSEKDYAYSQFVVPLEVDAGVLLYNTLTCEMVLLENDERGTRIQNGYLARHWFLFPKEVDQHGMCKMFKQIFRNMYKKKSMDKIMSYTIMTTTNCNARCPYCYEVDCIKQDMSEQTAQDVCDYIVKTSDGKCNIQWFGGEPLFNKKVIDAICKGLKEKVVFFSSTIITNGYLVDTCTPDDIKAWNLRQAQITLDGTADTYNSVKNYIYEDEEDPFSKVIKNIKYLLDNEVTVAVRLNISSENVDNLHELIDFLYGQFAGYSRFSIYGHPLFGGCDYHGFPEGTAEDYISIQEHIRERGMAQDYSLESVRILSHCMADNKISVVITPNGSLGLCEHFSDTELIGDIYHDKLNTNLMTEWGKEYSIPECSSCSLLPQCTKIKKCPVVRCTDSWREHTIYQLKTSMKKVYENSPGGHF